MHYLYVIADSLAGPVKLGISKDPQRRVKQLQTGHANHLRVFHAEPFPAAETRLYERCLHRDLGYLRRQGEWFDLSVVEAIAHIGVLLIEQQPSDLRP